MYDKSVQVAVDEVMGEVISIISSSEIRGEYLYYNDIILTAAQLKSLMTYRLKRRDIIAKDTIVASGVAGADFHSTYEGPIIAHSPTMIDLFPYSAKTGYYADITRTVSRGQPSAMHVAMYNAVLDAQESAIELVRDGVTGFELHAQADSVLAKHGFTSRTREGFPHTLGHGVGLKIHQQPSIYWHPNKIRAGDIITIEPGLYFDMHGGIRIEDMLEVTEDGYINLSQTTKQFVV